MEPETSPAAQAIRAMRAVEQRQREAWLAGFAADALLEDPVGHAPPRRGADAIADFWDTGIAALENVRFDVRRAHEGPREALMLVDVTARAPGGASASYDAALHYVFDEQGAIVALRAFWDLPDVVAQFTGAAAAAE
ncbi:MAG TPA: nuclear transport factor 2 family protein [Conexibacter sp.]|nr:nuclear transport factor 2 family protein [Conexibacter sp.]